MNGQLRKYRAFLAVYQYKATIVTVTKARKDPNRAQSRDPESPSAPNATTVAEHEDTRPVPTALSTLTEAHSSQIARTIIVKP